MRPELRYATLDHVRRFELLWLLDPPFAFAVLANEGTHGAHDREKKSRRNPGDPVLIVAPAAPATLFCLFPEMVSIPRFMGFPILVFLDRERRDFDDEIVPCPVLFIRATI